MDATTTLLMMSLIYIGVWLIAAAIIGEVAAARTKEIDLKWTNRKIAWGLVTFAILCMYVVWISAFCHQLNPLIRPKLEEDIADMVKKYYRNKNGL